MINHYFFIRQLAFQLNNRLAGSRLLQVISPDRHELFLLFEMQGNPQQLRINFESKYSLLQFLPNTNQLPKRYEKQLFDAWEQDVIGVQAVIGERLIVIQLEGGFDIWLKCYGHMGNALLLYQNQVRSVFRRSRQRDFEFNAKVFEFDSPHNTFNELLKALPHLPATNRWENPTADFSLLQHPEWFASPCFGVKSDPTPVLLPELCSESGKAPDYLGLSDQFLRTWLPYFAFDKRKKQLFQQFQYDLTKAQKRVAQLEVRINELKSKLDYEQQAHLLLAFAHEISPGSTQVLLRHWDNPEVPVLIKLNPRLTVAENANLRYQKAKNQHLEQEQLQEALLERSQALQTAHANIEALQACKDFKGLQKFEKQVQATQHQEQKPWRVYQLGKFEVWIGKHARGNDEILRRAHKDDLWMHARRLAGSHLLIRNAGRQISGEQLEQAASWAAFYSKGKSEALCPVICTPRKFVRKPKSAPPGAVLVEKEKVLLVAPQQP
ncbi:MAG: NFACT RNA binding domain-containing protein [Bacteroidia bacterium]